MYLYSSAVFQQYYIGNVKFPTNLDENEVFDYVVIGAGTAGSLVAARLSEDPSVTVLLMDRGGSGNDFTDIRFFSNGVAENPKGYSGPPLFKVYETTPQKYACADEGGKCVITQGNALGGGSNANSNYERGSPLDFDEWERMGARGWSYIDVLPFFKSTEKFTNDTLITNGYHGTKGDQFLTNTITLPEYASALQAAAQEQGFIVNKDYSDAQFTNSFGFTQNYIHRGQVYTSRCAFLAPAFKRKNLKVICFAQATQVLFNGVTATGVKYRARGEDHVVKVLKEVIVSSGPIGSPQLLMLSGIGDEKELRALGIPVVVNLPSVGKNLQDQAALRLAFKLQKTP